MCTGWCGGVPCRRREGIAARGSEIRISYPKYPMRGRILALRQFRFPQQDVSGATPEVAGRGRRKAPPAELDVLVPEVLRGRRTIQEIVAEALRDAIVTGRLKGGERLHQDGIAVKLGVSRMPVREALRQLESEGLVVFTPHRRVSVAALSTQELR